MDCNFKLCVEVTSPNAKYNKLNRNKLSFDSKRFVKRYFVKSFVDFDHQTGLKFRGDNLGPTNNDKAHLFLRFDLKTLENINIIFNYSSSLIENSVLL